MEEMGPLIIITLRTYTMLEPKRLTWSENSCFAAWCLACRFCLYQVMDTGSVGSLGPSCMVREHSDVEIVRFRSVSELSLLTVP
jgi:hypothetical protein